MSDFAAMMLLAAVIDIAVGWPNALYNRIGHPVTWLGALISRVEPVLNSGTRARRIWSGGALVALCLILVGLPVWGILQVIPQGLAFVLVGAFLAWPWIAIRSMYEHVRDVALPLAAGHLGPARQAVAMIVGRDPEQLDENGIARAAIESLGENTSDGIFAPVFWGVIGGPPGIAMYKAVNTLDSMIGHRNEQYEAFGKIAARLDDVMNWIPARLTGLVFALIAGLNATQSVRVMWRDASSHRSPNAGWPEGALAGALGIRLSGPRIYGDHRVEEPWLNPGAPDPTGKTVLGALSHYIRAIGVLMLALLGLALI
ncbi:MAG: adenosylcobinamide-phosphate synthase CbiB [Arenibacterium sp.]